jgi:diacylglycerol kinase family enzyme
MADPFDSCFDVVVIRKLSPLKVIANVKNLFSGKHLRLHEVSVFRTREFEIIATPYTFGEVEGELLTLGNFIISMIAQKVNVLMINE